jgi:serine/threonine protein kinase
MTTTNERKVQPKQAYNREILEERVKFFDGPDCSNQDFIGISTYNVKDDPLPIIGDYPNLNYKFIKKICNGSASKLYVANDGDSSVIVKKISKNEIWREELNILKQIKTINSPRLLNLIDFYESFRYSYIVTSYYGGPDLFEQIIHDIPLSLSRSKKIIKEMLLCIKDCHDNGIAHLDIKFENFMTGRNGASLVLIDFGHATNISKLEIKHGIYQYGTDNYICPEGYSDIHSVKSDIWPIGICLHLLLTGEYPFSTDDYKHDVLNKRMKLLETDSESEEFILYCLEYNIKKRPYADELLESDYLRD